MGGEVLRVHEIMLQGLEGAPRDAVINFEAYVQLTALSSRFYATAQTIPLFAYYLHKYLSP